MDRNRRERTSPSWSWSDIAVGVGMVGAAVGATYGLYKLTENEQPVESRRQALPQPKKKVVSMDCEMIQGKNKNAVNRYDFT